MPNHETLQDTTTLNVLRNAYLLRNISIGIVCRW